MCICSCGASTNKYMLIIIGYEYLQLPNVVIKAFFHCSILLYCTVFAGFTANLVLDLLRILYEFLRTGSKKYCEQFYATFGNNYEVIYGPSMKRWHCQTVTLKNPIIPVSSVGGLVCFYDDIYIEIHMFVIH
jgi:hypothetical protein